MKLENFCGSFSGIKIWAGFMIPKKDFDPGTDIPIDFDVLKSETEMFYGEELCEWDLVRDQLEVDFEVIRYFGVSEKVRAARFWLLSKNITMYPKLFLVKD